MSSRTELQAITFTLDKEMYGIEVHQIKEIIKVREYIKVPNAPDYVEGVINLRGQITPIVNLRKIFRMKEGTMDENSRIIMVEIDSEVMGLIVDSVVGVVTVPLKEVVKTPTLASTSTNVFITGIIRAESQLIILIDVVKLMEEVKANHSQQIRDTLSNLETIQVGL
ncbi:MAG: chemotaxis protein CheW [Candidatus Methanomethylicaceae archaeon]